jgi:DNA mismatch repair ATPase MutS
MLSGTNSRERAIACRSVLMELHGAPGAFGIVTTHDLDLARASDGPPLAFYHFADRFDGEALHFDYQLRQGIATTTNAIRVLEIEGIPIQH